jgi:molybdopterin/thiamine biosynthesis adenylyltransferase
MAAVTSSAEGNSVGQTQWSYEEAFKRNRGLISPDEQQVLRRCRVAVVGMGGVGGIDLVTLARLGIGRFSIADPDVFEVSNCNRQYGATRSTLGRAKVSVMADIVKDINPDADIRIFEEPISRNNADRFLEDCQVLIDGIDAFAIDCRRLLYRKAAQQGIYAIGAGPVGFSTVWSIFDPKGMTFDEYFGLSDPMDNVEKFAAYLVGMAPRATHRRYIDYSYVNVKAQTGPSVSLACDLAAGVIAAEVLKVLLKRGRLRPAPYYHQFDVYLNKYICRRLRGGGRNPVQQLKKWALTRVLRSHMA